MIKCIARVTNKQLNYDKTFDLACNHKNMYGTDILLYGNDFISLEFEFNITSSVIDEFDIDLGIGSTYHLLKSFRLTSTGPQIIKLHYNDIKDHISFGSNPISFKIEKVK